ncbi:hypothetical protein ACIQZG_16560 [Lysinibacillus sp. NPDC096418]|uniref:hypothetical protein n=1 Tax=Lysinibacillus sp. NPDC096418 TaxID=3364138 RepID=UPI003821EC41
MTPFKEKLNKELGESSYFTKELQATILQKAQQPPKKKRHWQYPVVLASMSAIVLFFIITGPWITINPSKQATLNEIARMETVKQFGIAWNWEDDSFKAGRVGWIFDQEGFQHGQETELLEQVLHHAELSEKDTRYSPFRDVWVQFEDGQIAKLKMQSKNEQLAFIDINTDLFYKVDDVVAGEFLVFFNSFEQDDLLSNWIFIFLLGLLLLRWIVEIVVRKIFNIQKGPKYISRGHQLATIICSVIYGLIVIVFIIKGWLIYYSVILGIFIMVAFSNIAIDFYYGREEKRHYVTIATAIFVGISLIILILLLKM